jgi:hypothetical protein
MFGGLVSSSVNAALPVVSQTETFSNGNGVGMSPGRTALVSFLTVIIVLAILLFVGKYLWNEVLVSLVPGVKPAKSVFQILGLAILIMLMAPGCNCMY